MLLKDNASLGLIRFDHPIIVPLLNLFNHGKQGNSIDQKFVGYIR